MKKSTVNNLSWLIGIFTLIVWILIAEAEGVRADRIQNEAVELGYAIYDETGEFIWLKKDLLP